MNFIARKFGTLLFLVLVIGIAAGAIMARRGMEVTLLSVRGVTISLGKPTPRPAAVAVPGSPTGGALQGGVGTTTQTGQPGAATAGGLVAGRSITGTVQQVDGTTITLTVQNGALTRATVSSSTTYMKNTTITAADIKVGDTVAVTGQAAPDGSITAQQVTDGAVVQTGGAGGVARQGGSGSGQAGTGITASTGITRSTGGQAAASAIVGTVQVIDSSSMTIVEQGGQTIKATLTTSTRLHKATAVTLTDITLGDQATIIGQTAADGTITATVVQISSPS